MAPALGALIRIKDYPSVCKSFELKQDALDWAQETERSIKRGEFNFKATKQRHTYLDLIERLPLAIVLEKIAAQNAAAVNPD
jgi:hypothetical protein